MVVFKSHSFSLVVAVKFNKFITRFFTISVFFLLEILFIFLFLFLYSLFLGIRIKESSFFTSIHLSDIPNIFFLSFLIYFFLFKKTFLDRNTRVKKKKTRNPKDQKSLWFNNQLTDSCVTLFFHLRYVCLPTRRSNRNDDYHSTILSVRSENVSWKFFFLLLIFVEINLNQKCF